MPLKANEQDSEKRAECGVLLQRVGNSEAKHVDTFNASDSRQSHQAPHKKDFGFCQGLFYLRDEGENPFEGSSASELRLECFCDWTKSKKQNTELPLNANEQDTNLLTSIF